LSLDTSTVLKPLLSTTLYSKVCSITTPFSFGTTVLSNQAYTFSPTDPT
jgi:hypothetical protein